MISGWGGSPFEAPVRRVAPGAFTKISAPGLEEQRVHVLLDFVSAPPPELGHAYHVDVVVVVWDGQGAPRVPSPALFRAADGWAAFLVRSGRARSGPVETGPNDGNWTVVTSGLRAGDEVIAQPSDAIRDGTRVRSE